MRSLRTLISAGLVIFFASTLHTTASDTEIKPPVEKKAMDPFSANTHNAFLVSLEKIYIKHIVRDYLCRDSDIASVVSDEDIAKSFGYFDTQHKKLADAVHDPKMSTIIAFIAMNRDKLKTIFSQPYSLAGVKKVLNLSKSISDGEDRLNLFFDQNSSYEPSNETEAGLAIATISQLYAIHHADAQDNQTLSQMRQEIARFDTILSKMQAQPYRTIPMSQILDKIDIQWKIVRKFYLDVDQNDLPLIVCRMTNKISHALDQYSKLVADTPAGSH